MKYKYKHAILGGTFDHMHIGHKQFLDYAFENSEKVTVGIATSTLFNTKILYSYIQSYDIRKNALEAYLRIKGYLDRARLIRLKDIYGNSLNDRAIDAIFVSESGVKNAELINKKRRENKFLPVEIVIVPLCNDSQGNAISATGIRIGVSDRNGDLFQNYFDKDFTLILPRELRKNLQKPFGKIAQNLEDSKLNLENKFVIAIGDIVTANSIKSGLKPNIAIFDLMTKRKIIVEKSILNLLPTPEYNFPNKQGTINTNTALQIQKIINKSIFSGKKVGIQINGEEDLLTLPAILFAPLNAVILYGIKDIGMVIVKVTEHKKLLIRTQYLNKFIKLKLTSGS
ncbi:MAG: pantetheine-phosphate adenylyltransferase [Candidatus Levybacteria bacterium]|nr:pantetheine-phosphate adenylyltransferase [Candidatus Levybacteria bacterium]